MTAQPPRGLDYTQPTDPRSRAWCSEEGCGWRRWGIWSHVDAKAHSETNGHLVHLITPDDEETKQSRRDYMDEMERLHPDA